MLPIFSACMLLPALRALPLIDFDLPYAAADTVTPHGADSAVYDADAAAFDMPPACRQIFAAAAR